jgi:hypothetical protein
MRYAVISNGKIRVRALPTKDAARGALAAHPNGKVIIDPRSIVR